MSEQDVKPARVRILLAEAVGGGLWLISLAWWYFYYSQLGGLRYLFEQKFVCVAVTTDICLAIQQQLVTSDIPTYYPELVWAGAIFLVMGFLQRRSRRV
jgi:hypothetical protein